MWVVWAVKFSAVEVSRPDAKELTEADRKSQGSGYWLMVGFSDQCNLGDTADKKNGSRADLQL